jgi:SAM-dependent methyltransferase
MSINCYVCNSTNFNEIFNAFPSMSSDGQTVEIPIVKEECLNCGTLRSTDVSFLGKFYSSYYKLNTSNLDPTYIYNGIAQPKSEMHYEWITKLCGNELKSYNSIIEIGCGSGNLLKLFTIPTKFGVEPSEKAAQHASLVANVRNIGFEQIYDEEEYDVVFSSCVIEHTVNPNEFLLKANSILNTNGLAIIGLPIQDAESFDVFFLDHLHHFTTNQFIHLCEKNGFEVEKWEVGYKCMATIGYFMLRKRLPTIKKLSYQKNLNFYLAQKWLKNLDSFINNNSSSRLVAFGFGETSFFFQTYSKINSMVMYYIDDTRAGSIEKVVDSTKAKELGLLDGSIIVLLTNPHYHSFLKEKLKGESTQRYYSPFSNEITFFG